MTHFKIAVAALLCAASLGIDAQADSGQIVNWGYITAPVPSGVGSCSAVSAGYNHALAILSDGIVVAWGNNTNDECGPTSEQRSQGGSGPFWVKTGLGACLDVSAGSNFSVALKADGAVLAWGNSSDGKTTVPADLGRCSQVDAGSSHVVALQQSGHVKAWGQNGNGKCNVPSSLGMCSYVSAGDSNTLAVRIDGTVVGFGGNSWNISTPPAQVGACIAAEAASGMSFALRSSGQVVAWGDLGTSELIMLDDGQAFAKIAAANSSNLMVGLRSNGTVYVFGDNIWHVGSVPSDLGKALDVAVSAQGAFAIKAPPFNIAGVIPSSGPAVGGTRITISGSNFPVSPNVLIGGVPALEVVRLSASQISALTPAGVPGMAVVEIYPVSAEAFYYRPDCGSDLDQNGTVDGGDMAILLLDWGTCYSSVQASGVQEPPELLADEPALKTGTAKKE